MVADTTLGILYRDSQILIRDEAAVAASALLSALDAKDITNDVPNLSALHLRLLLLPRPADLPGVVHELDALAVQKGLPEGSVSLNHVLSGEPIYHGGPADLPDITTYPASAPPAPTVATPVVAVLDTGMPRHRANPWMLWRSQDIDELYLPPVPDPEPGDEFLLAAEAGHGLFVGSLVVRFSGGGVVDMRAPLDPDGYGDQANLLAALWEFTLAKVPVINMSLGAYTDGDVVPLGLLEVMEQLPPETVLVAAAGNNATSDRPFWPAAADGVVAVASVDIDAGTGTATASDFTNSGDWVDICTQGEKVKGWFPGGRITVTHSLKRTLKDAAVWDGTSFAAPVVAGEIARRVLENGTTAKEAWLSMVDELQTAGSTGPAGCGLLWNPRERGIGLDPREW